jgi:hypothetical protein
VPRFHQTEKRWFVNWGLQVAIICSEQSGVFAIDADQPDQWPDSRTAQYLSWADAISVRAGHFRGMHFHILADARALRHRFPVGGATTWGDIKARGFIPLPGSVHYSGVPYAYTGRQAVTATYDLIGAAMEDKAGKAREQARENKSTGGTGKRRTGAYDHDTARAGLVLKGLLDGKDIAVIRAEWAAAPDHDPGCQSGSKGKRFTDADFGRHLRTAMRKASETWQKRQQDRQWSDAIFGAVNR